MYLLDTNVISELRKVRSDKANKNVETWASSAATNSLYLSVVTVLELETGILLLERRDAVQGTILRTWLEHQVLPAFSGRILPVDIPVARTCAEMQVPDPRPHRDAWIAATALVHGMTVVTRHVVDFEHMGVQILNPWE
ncbi:MAG: type II toxin-antitoxin system VapC family toxin [Gammaproteobacteria bacterium]|nr:type II toxin-antitoxin system VapC family toxin [Gammaproteobacteria bacterium]